jgi:hypothetical protein
MGTGLQNNLETGYFFIRDDLSHSIYAGGFGDSFHESILGHKVLAHLENLHTLNYMLQLFKI